MATKTHTLKLDIVARDLAGPALKKVSAGVRAVDTELKQAGRTAGSFGNQLRAGLSAVKSELNTIGMAAGAAGAAMAGIGAAFIAPMVGAVKTAAEFEHAMNGVKAVANAAAPEFARLGETARRLGASTQFTATQVAEGMKFLAMTGYDAGQVLQAIGPMLNLAAASGMELGRAADIVSNIMQGFGMAAEDAARATNVLAVTATNSNTNIEQLGEAMKYAAPAARSMGMSIEQAAAAIGVMSDAGIQGSMAGTGLRRMLLRLVMPTAGAKKAFRELGVTVARTSDGNVDFAATMERLHAAGMTAAQATRIFGVYASSAALATASAADKMRRLEWQAIRNTDALDKMVKTMTGDFRGAIVRLSSAFQALGESLGGPWLGTLAGITDGFANLVRAAAGLLQRFPLLGAVIGGVAGVFGAALAAAGGLALALAGIGWVVGTLTTAWGRLTGVKTAETAATALSTTAIEAETAALTMNTRAMWLNAQAAAARTATSAAGAAADAAGSAASTLGGLGAGAGILTRLKALATGLLMKLRAVVRFFTTGLAGAVALGAGIGLVAAKTFDWLYGATAVTKELDAETEKLGKRYDEVGKKLADLEAKTGKFKPLPVSALRGMDPQRIGDYEDKLGLYLDKVHLLRQKLINISLEKKRGVTDYLAAAAKEGTLFPKSFGRESTDRAKAAQASLKKVAHLYEYLQGLQQRVADVKAGKTFREDGQAAIDTAGNFRAAFRAVENLAEKLGTNAKEARNRLRELRKESGKNAAEVRKDLQAQGREMDRFREKSDEALRKAGKAWSDLSGQVDGNLSKQQSGFDKYLGAIEQTLEKTAEYFGGKAERMGNAISEAFSSGKSSEVLSAMKDGLAAVADKGAAAFKKLKEEATRLLDDLKSRYRKVTDELKALEQRDKKEEKDISDWAEKEQRRIRRSRMTEPEKQAEAAGYFEKKLGRARQLAEQGKADKDLEKLKEAKRIYEELKGAIDQLPQGLRSTAVRTLASSLQGVRQVSAGIEKSGMEKEKGTLEGEMEKAKAVQQKADAAAKQLQEPVKGRLDEAERQIGAAKAREERRIKYVADLELDEKKFREQLRALQQKGVKIPVTPVMQEPVGGVGAPGFSTGGRVPGSGGGDIIPAMLTPGEFVMRVDAVKRYGVAFMHALNRGAVSLRGFAAGGLADLRDNVDRVRAGRASVFGDDRHGAAAVSLLGQMTSVLEGIRSQLQGKGGEKAIKLDIRVRRDGSIGVSGAGDYALPGF